MMQESSLVFVVKQGSEFELVQIRAVPVKRLTDRSTVYMHGFKFAIRVTFYYIAM